MTTLRRSTRITKPTPKALEATLLSAPGIPTRCSTRIAAQKRKSALTKLITRHPNSPISNFIEEYTSPSPTSPHSSRSDTSSTSSHSSFVTSHPSYPSGSESYFLGADNIKYIAGDALSAGSSSSLDSRLEGENEYEIDEFVVASDSDEENSSEAGSEITVVGGERRGSAGVKSVSSEGSGLFVTDDDESSLHALAPVCEEAAYRTVDPAAEPFEIAEEILDAVLRFRRRCNRASEPLRLEITREMWEAEVMQEEVKYAREQGVGRFKEGEGGRWLCTIGPVGR
jgi:hypothetical protein